MRKTSCVSFGERGAAAVEFAIILPVFIMLAVGMFTGGLTYNQKDHITHAAREGARYGATIPKDQFGPGDGLAWATNVRAQAISRTDGIVDPSLTGHMVCVALVTGNPPTVVTGSVSNYALGNSGGGACFTDGGADSSERVQLLIQRPGRISAVFFDMSPTLRSQAVAKFEKADD